MKRDFPKGEIAPFFVIKRNLEKKIYDGYYLSGAADLGYALITAPAGLKYALKFHSPFSFSPFTKFT